MKYLYVILIDIAMCSCNIHKDYVKVITRKVITEENDSICRSKFFFKNEPLNGKYKIKKHRLFNGTYGIWNVDEGYLNGKISYFKFGKPLSEVFYKKGLRNGKETYFYNGKIESAQTYIRGFPMGEYIFFDYNGVDTMFIINYFTDRKKMEIYIDEHLLDSNIRTYIGFLMNTCVLKAQEYQQNFYSRKDSSLLHTNIWIRDKNGEYELKY